MHARRRIAINRSARRGMTLIELLLAAMMTALITAAAATLLSGASNASAQSRNARTVTAAGHYTEGQIGTVIRQARAVGQVTPTRISLWLDDTNKDDRVQLSEVGVIYYESSSKVISILRTDAADTTPSSMSVTRESFQDAEQLVNEIRNYTCKVTQWAVDVQACNFEGYPALTDTRVVNATFTLATGSDATDFAVTASPKASGDYLFQAVTRTAPSGTETRFTRARVSPYMGASTAQ